MMKIFSFFSEFRYCKHRDFGYLTIIAIIATQRKTVAKFERYISHSSLCYIQAGKKSLKIPGAIIRSAANLKKPL